MKNLLYTSFPAYAPFALLFMMTLSQMETTKPDILGHWEYESITKEEIYDYSAKNSFSRTKGGIAFLEDGQLIVRQNAGWCGTPPVSYRNFDGTWKWIDEKTIELNYAFWGGTINEQWEIISSNKNNLKVKKTNYETIRASEEKEE